MRFFPLTLVCIAALVAIHWRAVAPTNNKARRWSAIGLFILASAAFLYSVINFSPWLSHGAIVLCFAAWALGRWGNYHWGAVIGWACVLATTLPLPWGWDESVLAWLQGFATWATACSLDALQIACLRNGSLLEIRGLSLFANEVCDIWAGPYALLSFAAVLMAFQHRGIVVCAKVLGLVPLWTVLINWIRLLCITTLFEYSEINAASGRDFGLLVLGTILLGLFLIWLSSLFFRQMFMPIPVADAEFGPVFSALNKLFFWPLKDPMEEIPPDDEDDLKIFLRRKEKNEERLASLPNFNWISTPASLWLVRVFAICFVTGGGMTIGALAGGRLGELNFGTPTYTAAQMERMATEDSLPETLDGGWKRAGFTATQRSSRSKSGQFGLRWTYASSAQTFTFGIDLPFIGGQDPVADLVRRGWKSEQTRFKTQDAWPFGVAELENELGGQAYLFYSLYTVDGQPFSTEQMREQTSATEDGDASDVGTSAITQIVQLFIESGEELTETELMPFRDQFLTLRSNALKVTPRGSESASQ